MQEYQGLTKSITGKISCSKDTVFVSVAAYWELKGSSPSAKVYFTPVSSLLCTHSVRASLSHLLFVIIIIVGLSEASGIIRDCPWSFSSLMWEICELFEAVMPVFLLHVKLYTVWTHKHMKEKEVSIFTDSSSKLFLSYLTSSLSTETLKMFGFSHWGEGVCFATGKLFVGMGCYSLMCCL